jgi:hypothetical protein
MSGAVWGPDGVRRDVACPRPGQCTHATYPPHEVSTAEAGDSLGKQQGVERAHPWKSGSASWCTHPLSLSTDEWEPPKSLTVDRQGAVLVLPEPRTEVRRLALLLPGPSWGLPNSRTGESWNVDSQTAMSHLGVSGNSTSLLYNDNFVNPFGKGKNHHRARLAKIRQWLYHIRRITIRGKRRWPSTNKVETTR